MSASAHRRWPPCRGSPRRNAVRRDPTAAYYPGSRKTRARTRSTGWRRCGTYDGRRKLRLWHHAPMKTVLAFAVALGVALPASAQVDQVTTPPPNLVLSNYDSVPVGPFGGLEGSAYVARVGDPS